MRRKFQRRLVIVHGIDSIWAAYIEKMKPFSRHNKGYRYLLIVIDICSEYGWMRKLKDNDVESVADAFKDIVIISKRKSKKVLVNKGWTAS